MKKVLAIFVSVLLLASLSIAAVGCKKAEEPKAKLPLLKRLQHLQHRPQHPKQPRQHRQHPQHRQHRPLHRQNNHIINCRIIEPGNLC